MKIIRCFRDNEANRNDSITMFYLQAISCRNVAMYVATILEVFKTICDVDGKGDQLRYILL